MYNNSLKLPVMQEVSNCSYPIGNRDYVINQVLDVLSYPAKAEEPKFSRKKMGLDIIICVFYQFSIPFGQKSYNVPVQILFMKNFPSEPPQIFIDTIPGSGINPKNTNIDQSTRRINTPYLRAWNTAITMSSVMEEIKQSFIKVFPIYKLPSNQPNPQNSIYGGAYKNMTGQIANSFMGGQNNYNQFSSPQQWGQRPIQNIYGNLGNKGPTNSFINTNNSNPEEKCKSILIQEIMNKVEGKIKSEKQKNLKESSILNNYQNQFNIEIEKLNNFVNNRQEIENQCTNDLNEISSKVNELTESNKNSSVVEITKDNAMSFVNIDEGSKKLIFLVAKEAYLEESLTICKKGFEKQIISFPDAIKYMRSVSRDIFSTKFLREKASQELNY